jgi:hypothetical protein
VAGHIFQARPVWIYTQSNITNIIYIFYNARSFIKETSRVTHVEP